MSIDFLHSNEHAMVKGLHIFISSAFLVCAVWLIIRSARGIIRDKSYTRIDTILSYAFLFTLYLQLVFGLLLFTDLGSMSGYDYLGGTEGTKMVSKRLWPIEHIVMMFFALLIANLGLILSLKTNLAREKHKKILIYYSVCILLIVISLSKMYLF